MLNTALPWFRTPAACFAIATPQLCPGIQESQPRKGQLEELLANLGSHLTTELRLR